MVPHFAYTRKKHRKINLKKNRVIAESLSHRFTSLAEQADRLQKLTQSYLLHYTSVTNEPYQRDYGDGNGDGNQDAEPCFHFVGN